MAYTTIDKSSLHFDSKLWNGTGSAQSITGLEFEPDWVWVKNRSRNSYHTLVDAVRGSSNVLSTNATNAQYADAQQVSAFTSDGFSVGTSTNTNASGESLVGWSWKANGQGSSNTDGTINTTYTSVNTTSGFSVSQYTGNGSVGATVGHGLGAVPKMIIVKNLGATGDWVVYNEAIGNTKRLKLNSSLGEETNAFWNDTTPTSSVWSMNDNGDGNGSGSTYIAYCFAEKQGFSKFGTYTGTANVDGAFVYTGFKPAWIMTKKTVGSGYHWFIFDNKRDGYNNSNKRFEASSTALEADTSPAGNIDILSNGFKIRTTDGHIADAGKYIFMAFAEAPLVGSNNVPCTAR